MKRWLTHTVIAVYLSCLSWGIISHAVNFGTGAHPAMYFVVWDMFCGWTAFAGRTQVIAEGESGKYYQLAPGPWGEFHPYGNIGRRHYDSYGYSAGKFGLNALRHTKHEPIDRIFVIQESWAKKFNIPDELWNRLYEEPKDLKKYYQVKLVVDSEGRILQTYQNWLDHQNQICVSNNPRLRADTHRSKPFYVFGSNNLSDGRFSPFNYYNSQSQSQAQVGSRMGN